MAVQVFVCALVVDAVVETVDVDVAVQVTVWAFDVDAVGGN